WRRTRDPYAIWLSEIMLQQTQVNRVLNYYEEFLAAFPTVEALSRARLERVLRLWSGLGYYRRAENLHKAARQLIGAHGGKLPQDYGQLRALAGIGDYTAGAILSIAFHKPYPAIDGNARRVLGRIFAFAGERELRAGALKLVPKTNPGEFNQALMELGATICAPKKPRCPDCPVKLQCASLNRKHPLSAKSKRPQMRVVKILWPLAILRRRGKILLRRRSADRLLAGLWELPGVTLKRAAKRGELPAILSRELPLPSSGARLIGEFEHAITHRRIRAPVYLFECTAQSTARLARTRWRWSRPARLSEHAVSSMTLKAAKLLADHEARLR
ncbi:MAG TPA: A/G-specific adenine glycosylase, partial [Candidatus Limnocylindria bacterium]|nr:A/G-specific adenine glycosylase [Candidatus Limnocylindria bacterium]